MLLARCLASSRRGDLPKILGNPLARRTTHLRVLGSPRALANMHWEISSAVLRGPSVLFFGTPSSILRGPSMYGAPRMRARQLRDGREICSRSPPYYYTIHDGLHGIYSCLAGYNLRGATGCLAIEYGAVFVTLRDGETVAIRQLRVSQTPFTSERRVSDAGPHYRLARRSISRLAACLQ